MATTFLGFLIIWILLAAYALGQYSMNLKVTPLTPTIRESGRVEIVCDVTTELDSAVKMAWIKRTGNGSGKGGGGGRGAGAEEKEIATNTQLSHEFKSSNRYQVSEEVVQRNAKYRFTLTITGLQTSDSGEIGCQLPSNHIEIFRPLIVHSPAKIVRLSSNDLTGSHAALYSDGDKVTFKEGEAREVTCRVHGAYPEPKVRILLGARDLTDRFRKTSTKTGSGSTTSKDLQPLSYTVEMTNKALDITYDFSGKELKCIADVNGDDAESRNTSIMIDLHGYRPKFECPSEVKVKLHQTNVELRCNVSAQPEVSHARFHWKRHTTGNGSIEAGKGDGPYQGSFQSKPGEDSSKEMILTIHRVFPQHFRAYFFEAENSEGKTIHRIELKRDGHVQKLNGGASLVFPTFTSIVSIIVSIIVFYSALPQ